MAISATTLRTRPEWQQFRGTAMYDSFLNGVARMRANSDYTDPFSWGYWVHTHKYFCPHRMPYFLAWHRGFLYRLEGHLRKVSGDSSLVVPYWNYFADPRMPPEFTDPASPLYLSGRVSDDVSAGLDLDAFSPTLVRFPRGKPDAFEPVVEAHPHNPVHNLIGGAMARVSVSPKDPIFWVHHANIDRLWAAWVAAGDGRHMPATTNSYWSGSFNYGAGVHTMPRLWTYTTSRLGYAYDDLLLPASLPPSTARLALAATSLQALSPVPGTATPASFGSTGAVALDRHGATLRVPLSASQQDLLRSALIAPGGGGAHPVTLVLDSLRLTPRGARGGFFYLIVVGPPDAPVTVGTLGPFEISAMRRMGMGTDASGGVRMSFPLVDALRRAWPLPLDRLEVRLVARSAGSVADTALLTMGRMQVTVGGP